MAHKERYIRINLIEFLRFHFFGDPILFYLCPLQNDTLQHGARKRTLWAVSIGGAGNSPNTSLCKQRTARTTEKKCDCCLESYDSSRLATRLFWDVIINAT